jgi:hypothetical protein
VTAPASRLTSEGWFLLVHQIPPKPDYLRVKIGRRLQQAGAVAVKNSVYLLPGRPQSLEDFQWIRSEVIDGGGDAIICRVEFVHGLSDDECRLLFHAARNADYADVAAAARELRARLRHSRRDAPGRAPDEIARLRKRLTAIEAIDFFGAPDRELAVSALRALDTAPQARRSTTAPAPVDRREYRNRTWVTRAGVFVDRIASAWLIRRYIDSGARFRFVEGTRSRPATDELRFDMVGGEFTHVGDRCTFETMIERFAIDDPALTGIAEIVHDIDLKDGKFGRDEAAGVERVLAGIVATHPTDDARIERGGQLFDELYASMSRNSSGDP